MLQAEVGTSNLPPALYSTLQGSPREPVENRPIAAAGVIMMTAIASSPPSAAA